MVKRRGRPPVADEAALRRVADYIVDAEQKGARCSARAAISRACLGVPGNSSEAVLRRLQRKWSRYGPALLAEARERKARRQHVANVPMLGGLERIADAVTQTALCQDDIKRAVQVQEEIKRALGVKEEVLRAFRLQDEIRRAWGEREDFMRALRLQDEIRRTLRGW